MLHFVRGFGFSVAQESSMDASSEVPEEGGGAGRRVRAEAVVDHEFRKAEEERFRLIEAELSRGLKMIKKELNAKLDEFGRQLFQMLLSSRPSNLYRAQQSRSDEVLEEDQDTLCDEDTGEKPQQELVLMSRSALSCLFEKELRAYDVGFSNRIHLPKDETERCMPYLTNMEGICIVMEDMVAAPLRWKFTYRFVPNKNTRTYFFSNTGGFVKRHNLGIGDMVQILRDHSGNYVILAKKVLHAEASGNLAERKGWISEADEQEKSQRRKRQRQIIEK